MYEQVGGFLGPSFNAQVNVERMYETAMVDIFVQNSSTSMHSACGVLGSARLAVVNFNRLLGLFRSDVYTTDPANGLYHHSILSDVIGDGILTVDGERWQHQRKVASYELSTKVMRDFSSAVFKTNAVKLAHIISEAATCDQAIEIQVKNILILLGASGNGLFMKASLDSVIKIFLGIELETMRGTNEEGTRFSNAFDEANANTLYRYVDFSWEIILFLNIGSEGVLKNNIEVMDQFGYKLIKSKIKTVHNLEDELPLKRRDILSRLLASGQTDPKYFRDIIFSLFVAGKDTAASTLTWFIYMVCKHPDIQEKIAQEVREATNLKDNSSIDELADNLTEETLSKMQYLVAALTETSRLYPAVPLNAKVCSSDDTWPDGFSVKKGDIVGYHAYSMGRMKYIWGDAGPRICVGKDFAYREMMIFCAVLLGSYTFKLRDENKEAELQDQVHPPY
ncbi:hypothetical protein PRUPE_2G284800 [Prunus persica]|uniref:Cytochrome P450 n=1 Tax=Prunus persica TaxID=3760 RepID=A0A251QR36_PRUPE|nr:hypothetical protein PRUPE_2G284800 [Prunus persica]